MACKAPSPKRPREPTISCALNSEEQAIARDIFLRLTELGEGRPDTRRRVSLDEIVPPDERAGEITALLASLADARLVTTDEGAAEVAHESLIQRWPRLRDWLDQDRESLRSVAPDHRSGPGVG